MALTELELEHHTEGRTHIRLSPQSRTHLGRLLANTAHTPFTHPNFGKFNSLEGLWAFLHAGANDVDVGLGSLRKLSGDAAESATLRVPRREFAGFRGMLLKGLDAKIDQTPQLKELLAANKLDLIRYDILDGEAVICPGQSWFLDHLEKIAKGLKCRSRTNSKEKATA